MFFDDLRSFLRLKVGYRLRNIDDLWSREGAISIDWFTSSRWLYKKFVLMVLLILPLLLIGIKFYSDWLLLRTLFAFRPEEYFLSLLNYISCITLFWPFFWKYASSGRVSSSLEKFSEVTLALTAYCFLPCAIILWLIKVDWLYRRLRSPTAFLSISV